MKSVRPTNVSELVIITDIDGTLARTHDVSDYTFSVLQRLARAGAKTIIVTGRSEPSAMAIARRIDPDSGLVVSNNGALISHVATGERIFEDNIDQRFCRDVIDFCAGTDYVATVFCPDDVYVEQDGWPFELMTVLNGLTPVLVDDWSTVPLDRALKVMVGMHESRFAEMSGPLLERFPMFMATLPNYVETSSPTASKTTSVPAAMKALGLDFSQAIGFGDAQNDAGWLSQVAWAVVPESAYPHMRELADEVIGPHYEDSVAHYLEQTYLS